MRPPRFSVSRSAATPPSIAKERLQIVLAHERASRDAPDFLPALQKELLDVVGRYIEIRDDMLRVNVGRSGETSLLEINVELDGAKIKPVKNGAGAEAKPKPMPAPWRRPTQVRTRPGSSPAELSLAAHTGSAVRRQRGGKECR